MQARCFCETRRAARSYLAIVAGRYTKEERDQEQQGQQPSLRSLREDAVEIEEKAKEANGSSSPGLNGVRDQLLSDTTHGDVHWPQHMPSMAPITSSASEATDLELPAAPDVNILSQRVGIGLADLRNGYACSTPQNITSISTGTMISSPRPKKVMFDSEALVQPAPETGALRYVPSIEDILAVAFDFTDSVPANSRKRREVTLLLRRSARALCIPGHRTKQIYTAQDAKRWRHLSASFPALKAQIEEMDGLQDGLTKRKCVNESLAASLFTDATGVSIGQNCTSAKPMTKEQITALGAPPVSMHRWETTQPAYTCGTCKQRNVTWCRACEACRKCVDASSDEDSKLCLMCEVDPMEFL